MGGYREAAAVVVAGHGVQADGNSTVPLGTDINAVSLLVQDEGGEDQMRDLSLRVGTLCSNDGGLGGVSHKDTRVSGESRIAVARGRVEVEVADSGDGVWKLSHIDGIAGAIVFLDGLLIVSRTDRTKKPRRKWADRDVARLGRGLL